MLGTVRTVGRDFISKARSTGRDVKLTVDRERMERGVFAQTHQKSAYLFYHGKAIYYGHTGTFFECL